MELRKECIGENHTAKAPNGTVMSVTIQDDESQFGLYSLLGLNVFVIKGGIPPKKSKHDITALSKLGLKDLREYAAPFGVKGRSKKDIIDGLTSD